MEAGGAEEREIGKCPKTASPRLSRRSWRTWFLVFGAFVILKLLYAAILAVPFLLLTTGQKIWVSVGLVVVAETIFLFSVFFLGREVVRRYRRYLDPRRWFGKGRY